MEYLEWKNILFKMKKLDGLRSILEIKKTE